MRLLIVAAALIATPATAQVPERAACASSPASSGAQPTTIPIEVYGTLTQSISGALDFSGLVPRSGHRMDGMLGYDFIRRFVVAIDYVKQELRLYDPRAFHYDGPGTAIPLIFIDNQPHAIAEVRLADGASIKGRMVIDVGSGGALALTKPFADANHLRDRIGPTIQRPAAGIGGRVMSDVGRVAQLKLGVVEIPRPVTALAGGSAGNFSGNDKWIGNIGGDILRRFTVFLDYANKLTVRRGGKTRTVTLVLRRLVSAVARVADPVGTLGYFRER